LKDLHCLMWNCGRFFFTNPCMSLNYSTAWWPLTVSILSIFHYVRLISILWSQMLMIVLFLCVEWCSPVSMWHLSLFLQRACRSVCSWQVNSAAFHNFTMQMKTNWRWDELFLYMQQINTTSITCWMHPFLFGNIILTCIIILCLTGEEDGSSWCNEGGWQPATNKGRVQLGFNPSLFFSHICMVQDSWQYKFLWARFCTVLVSLMQYTTFSEESYTCRFGQLSVGIFGPNLLDNLFHEGLFTFCLFL
jgi:hypothetical protein